MARPLKSGLDYFPLDSNLFGDPKIEDLLFRHGPSGLAIFLAILCRIYREGYYLTATPEQITRMVIKDIGGQWVRSPALVLQVIRSCSELGIFDPLLLADDVFTSAGIQKRYAKATARSKGKMDKYCLIDALEENGIGEAWESAPENGVFDAENGVIVTETPVSVAETPMKEKKRKEKKIKEKRREALPPPPSPPPKKRFWNTPRRRDIPARLHPASTPTTQSASGGRVQGASCAIGKARSIDGRRKTSGRRKAPLLPSTTKRCGL